ncbi:MAG: DinB family protein [Bacteroidota bacterium]
MLNASARDLLFQLRFVVEQCKDSDFARSLPILSGATLGQHIRHTLEFFICLFDAKNDGVVNYDSRHHDELIETDRKLALSIMDTISDFLNESNEDFEIFFEANYTNTDGQSHRMKSSFHRELAYNIEHAIHHMALIKVAMKNEFDYIKLPSDFGIASSTIRYRSRQKQS